MLGVVKLQSLFSQPVAFWTSGTTFCIKVHITSKVFLSWEMGYGSFLHLDSRSLHWLNRHLGWLAFGPSSTNLLTKFTSFEHEIFMKITLCSCLWIHLFKWISPWDFAGLKVTFWWEILHQHSFQFLWSLQT